MNERYQLQLTNVIIILVLLMAFALNILSYFQLNNLLKNNKYVLHNNTVTDVIDKIALDIANIEVVSRGYVITNNKNYLTNYDSNLKNLTANLAVLKQLVKHNPNQAKLANSLEPLVQEKIAFIKDIIELRNSQGMDSAIQLASTGKGLTLSNQIQNHINEMNNNESSSLITFTNKFNAAANQISLFLLITNLISGFLLLGSFIFLNNQYRKQKLAEDEKRKSDSVLKGIIEGTNDYIAALNLNYQLIALNQSYANEFKRIFGIHLCLGMSLDEALQHLPKELQKAKEIWSRALAGEEFTVIGRFGDIKLDRNDYEIRYSSIRNAAGTIIGATQIVRNVTKKIAAETALKEANKHLEIGLEKLKKHDLEISTINHLDNILQACSNLEETFLPISIYCKKILPKTSGILYIFNSSQNYLEAAANWNKPQAREEIFSSDNCWALRQGKIYCFKNIEESVPCKHILSENILPYFCVPLLAQNEIIGLLYLEMKTIPNNKEQANIELLVTTLSEQISLGLANIKLREILKIRSIHDPLTNLYNRSYLNESIERELHRAKRENISVCIVMIDIDHFKNINDTYGHDAGDFILKEFSSLLLSNVRKSDIACRYGGEEFILLLYQASLEETKKRLEKIRQKLAKKDFRFADKSIGHITASFGIAIFPEDGENTDQLLAAADKALYEAKKTGRNKIVVHQAKKSNK